MSESNNQNGRKAVYTVVDTPSGTGKARWLRIGIAFINRDGSTNVLLDALPVNGKLHIRDFPPSEESEEGAAPRAEAAQATPARRSRPTEAAA